MLKKNKKFIILFLIILSFIGVLFFIFFDLDFLRFKKSINENPVLENPEFSLVLSDGKFFPDNLTIPKNKKIKIILKSLNNTCDFVMDDFSFNILGVSPVEEKYSEFIFDKEGEFKFYCLGLREEGSVGKFIVK